MKILAASHLQQLVKGTSGRGGRQGNPAALDVVVGCNEGASVVKLPVAMLFPAASTHTYTHRGAEEIFSRSYNVLSAASHVLISVALGLMRLPTAQLCGSSQLL